MLICDEFVVLNLPKTGSSFVRAVIKDIFRKRYPSNTIQKISQQFGAEQPGLKEILTHNLYIKGRRKGQHGTYIQIPEQYRDRPIVSVVRNPYSKFISGYEYKFWVKRPPVPKSILEHHFPTFPNLSMDQFVDFTRMAADNRSINDNKLGLGMQTLQFIQMFFKDPVQIMNTIDEAYINDPLRFQSDMVQVTLLRQEHLREDLSKFLKEKGFSDEETDIVKSFKRVNQTVSKPSNVDTVWTEKALDYIHQDEKFLLDVLSSHGMTYEAPKAGSPTRKKRN